MFYQRCVSRLPINGGNGSWLYTNDNIEPRAFAWSLPPLSSKLENFRLVFNELNTPRYEVRCDYRDYMLHKWQDVSDSLTSRIALNRQR